MIKVADLVVSQVVLYIDPGAGTIIVQILIAGAIAGLFMLKVLWRKCKVFLTRLFRRGND